MGYEAYLFDFDYTLADATPGIVACVNHALTEMGFPAAQTEEIRKTVGMPLRDTFRVLAGVSEEAAAERFLSLFRRRADDIMTDNTVLLSDTVQTLTRLRARGARVAIVTTKYRFRIEDALRKHGIAALVDCIVGSEDVKEMKPAPEGLYKAMELLSVDRSRVLYTGDSVIDAEAAMRAGIDFAGVTTGTTTATELEAFPHVAVAASLSELLERLAVDSPSSY